MTRRLITISILTAGAFLLSFIGDEKSSASKSALAISANQFMWDNLHQGNYDSIPAIISRLKAAYDKNPDNIDVTAHLGFTYLWSFCERGRGKIDSGLISNVFQSNRYFKEAIKLDPSDARLYGFQSATDICEGAIKKNLPMMAKGYMNSLLAIGKWPQFNKFAFSIVGSQRKKNTMVYKLGMKYQWQLIDECSCKKLDEKTVMAAPDSVLRDLIVELENSTDYKTKRACWNSWIAPHNLEGFFLNFGDMLVKEGQLEEAKEMYEAAKLAPSFNEWVYKDIIDERIRDLKLNRVEFNKPLDLYTSNTHQIFINSTISCVGCHQMSKNEFETLRQPPITKN